jgi:prepilin peptidase CpaA
MWAATVLQHQASVGQWGVVAGASLVAAVCDVRSGRIPNLLTGPLLLGGLACASWAGGARGLAVAAAGALVLALPYVILFAVAGGGAGDAKLMGAIGAWLGLGSGVVVLLCVLLAGAGLGMALSARQGRHGLVLERVARMAVALVLLLRAGRNGGSRGAVRAEDMQAMPYGVAIFAGVCIGAMVVFLWHGF